MKINRYVAILTVGWLAMVSSAGFTQDGAVRGEVKKIDMAAGKITLKHGPIKSLDMDDEGMTMVFRVSDPVMLKSVKVGDKVRFDAGRVNGQITVTSIQKSK